MPGRRLRLGEELIPPLHVLYDGLQVDGALHPTHRAAEHLVWVVTHCCDARKAFNHPGVRYGARQAAELYTRCTGSPCVGIGEGLSHRMFNLDPPDHIHLHSLVGRMFIPRQVERLQPHIEQVTEGLLGAMAGREQADLMAGSAISLTIAVIFELLGIPGVEHEHARQSQGRQAELLSSEEAQALADAQVDYLRVLLETKCQQPADNVYSGLVRAADESGQLSEAELTPTTHLLMMGGFEATMNMIGNALVTLLVNPEQLASLRTQPELLPNAMGELVRHGSPMYTSVLRFAVEGVGLGGTTIPAGEYILVSNLTANHSAKHFGDPDRLDFARNVGDHLGYSFDMHYCVDASLVRLEGRIVIQCLPARFPDPQLAVSHAELQ